MPRTKKVEEKVEEVSISVTPNELGWTDHVLGLLNKDELIEGNPTTDGLRRVFEIALNCTVIQAMSEVLQQPTPDNEKRATVVHTLSYIMNDKDMEDVLRTRSISGSADVYWGNCDKVFRNHPVAVAETRAEGRALRRALKLRKVVAAEELVEDAEDNPDFDSVSKITPNQINFIDIIAKRCDINVHNVIKALDIVAEGVYNIKHEDAVKLVRELTDLQTDTSNISANLLGYEESWK
jgi:hypothetical protein